MFITAQYLRKYRCFKNAKKLYVYNTTSQETRKSLQANSLSSSAYIAPVALMHPIIKVDQIIMTESLGNSIIISDLEHMIGSKVILNIRAARFVKREDYDYTLYTIVQSRAANFEYDFRASFDVAYNVFRHFIFSKDLDLLMDYMKAVYDFTHFPLTERLFRTFAKFFLILWNMANRRHGAIGLYCELSGKLSRHLLTKARTTKLRIGKTSAAERRLNVVYRYRQTTSDTGAYGLSVWYYTASKLDIKQIKKVE